MKVSNVGQIRLSNAKGAALTIQALPNALLHHPRPGLFHSDNGREYDAMAFTEILDGCGIMISRSRPGCPWENGYQESFYDKFKVDLGDPNRFKTLGELVAEIYRTLWDYNNTRIHSALNMPPVAFAKLYALVGVRVDSPPPAHPSRPSSHRVAAPREGFQSAATTQ
jgi:putative transposase